MSVEASAAIAVALRDLVSKLKESSEQLDAVGPILERCQAAVMSPIATQALAPEWRQGFQGSLAAHMMHWESSGDLLREHLEPILESPEASSELFREITTTALTLLSSVLSKTTHDLDASIEELLANHKEADRLMSVVAKELENQASAIKGAQSWNM